MKSKVVGANALAVLAVFGAGGSRKATASAQLPIPCVAGSCGTGTSGFVTSGQASATPSGNTLTINQASNKTTLNWQSFDISADGKVQFNQPSANAIALNRIYSQS